MSRRPLRRTREEAGFDGDDPDIIRGAKNNDFLEVEAALKLEPSSITKIDLVTGMTAAHYAAALGNFSMVEFLAAREGVDLYAKDKFERDVLDAAIECGHQKLVDFLFVRMFPQ